MASKGRDQKDAGDSKRKPRITRRRVVLAVKLLASLAVLGYLVLCLMYYFLQDDLLYLPSKEVLSTPGTIGLEYDDIYIDTQDGETLNAWYIPAENSTAVILMCHGNSGNIGAYLDHWLILHQCGFDLFVFDYRGFGRSTGETNEHGTYLDAAAAWKHLTQERGIPDEEIVVYGRSMGGPIAAWLASQHHPGALILESTFSSYESAARDITLILPVGSLSTFRYTTLEYMKKSDCPVQIIHSPDDMKIRYHNGRELYRAASEPKEFLKLKGGHPDCYAVSGDVYTDGVTSFIGTYV